VSNRAGAHNQFGAWRDRQSFRRRQYLRDGSGYHRPDQDEQREAIELAHAAWASQWTMGLIQKQRIRQQAFLALKNFVAALEPRERPTFIPGCPARTVPIQQDEICAGLQMKFLPLGVGGTSKRLDRIGRQDEEGVGPQFSTQCVAARATAGISVNLG